MDDNEQNQIFNSIISNNSAYFVSQQKNEPDLTLDQKFKILLELFETNKMKFVQRYSFLNHHQLNFIKSKTNSDQDVSYLIDSLIKAKLRKNIIKNRRYSAMRELIEKGQYFSDHEMNKRNPLLYEQMIGQYLSDEEKEQLENDRRLEDNPRNPLSNFFLNQLENNQIEMKKLEQATNEYNELKKEYSNQVNNHYVDQNKNFDDVVDDDGDDDKPLISEKDKQILRKNFTKIMYEQFLNGDDKEYFDYSKVDNNDDYDPIDLMNRDAEDSYFDSEEAKTFIN